MTRPGLLVSVRNGIEASIAERAGADLLDLKEPGRGPLGCCDESVWVEVKRRINSRKHLSAALGEWNEWCGISDEVVKRRLMSLEGFRFAKIGPGGSVGDGGQGLLRCFARLGELAPPGLGWIAVVYADRENGSAVDRNRVVSIARETGCVGVLIDTFDKSRPIFWDVGWHRFVRGVQEQNLLVALAGGLTARSMRRVFSWEPGWFAVRGAACRDGQRGKRVSFRRVRSLAGTLDRTHARRFVASDGRSAS